MTELAWAAGFFDGEGSVGTYFCDRRHKMYGGKPQKNIIMSVSQKDIRPLLRFQEAIGFGEIRERKLVNKASEWRVQRFELVQQTCCLLWNWLSEPKREQIEQALRTYHK